MKIGIWGYGTVGKALHTWMIKNGNHDFQIHDPALGSIEIPRECQAVFMCIPVLPAGNGQEIEPLRLGVDVAKSYNPEAKIFIRSTVLPGTNDLLETISCPEFLTQRNADDDMEQLPVLIGNCPPRLAMELFPKKEILYMSNSEAELAKFTHNCFGAMKVTYFNMIYKICQDLKLDYEQVLTGVFLSKHINKQHTNVPGPDKELGYGGKCFPENMNALTKWMFQDKYKEEKQMLEQITKLNLKYRFKS